MDDLTNGFSEAEAKFAKARAVLKGLCEGTQRWTMSVPARPESDPDLVIAAALKAGEDAIARLRAPAALPEGFVPLRLEWEPGYPEDVAFGTQMQMDRLKKWLDKYFAMVVLAERAAAPSSAPAPSGVSAPAASDDPDQTMTENMAPPPGYALVALDVMRVWGKYDAVDEACKHPRRIVQAPAPNAQPSELPPMPKAEFLGYMYDGLTQVYGYTADQMQAYARAAIAASAPAAQSNGVDYTFCDGDCDD